MVDIQFELKKKGELGSVISVGRVGLWCALYWPGIHGTPNDPVYTDLY